MEDLNQKFTSLESKFESLEGRFTSLENTVLSLVEFGKSNHTVINALVKLVDERFTKIDERFDKVEVRLGTIESKLNILTSETTSNFGNVDTKLESIAEELSKIEIATRYEQDFQDVVGFDRLRNS